MNYLYIMLSLTLSIFLSNLFFLFTVLSITKAETNPPWNANTKAVARKRIQSMFHHAYDNYMIHAFPADELRPLSCEGSNTWGRYALTLVDSLDTIAILGNSTEFDRAVRLVSSTVSFDNDINTSVFETNIRALGGLLSAHMLAADKSLGLMQSEYNDELLLLAYDLGQRLLPAFNTPTGMPFGTVNLRNGVPANETDITCTACIATFSVEFNVLSELTGDKRFEVIKEAARVAVQKLWSYRSPIQLLGTHINITSGAWTQLDSGIGGGVDSFFEYLFKTWLLYDDDDDTNIEIFIKAYQAVEQYLRSGNWHVDVNMFNAQVTSTIFTNLKMFWPGLQVLLGDVQMAHDSLSDYRRLLASFAFPPEAFDLKNGNIIAGKFGNPLRPEYVESLMYLYHSTHNPFWLSVGWHMINTLEESARVPCGYCTIAHVSSLELEDRMESFFLAETIKYLYLLFDDDESLYHHGNYIFTTEAHLIPLDPKKRKAPLLLQQPKLEGTCLLPQSPLIIAPQNVCSSEQVIRKRWVGSCPIVHYQFGFSVTGQRASLSSHNQCVDIFKQITSTD